MKFEALVKERFEKEGLPAPNVYSSLDGEPTEAYHGKDAELVNLELGYMISNEECHIRANSFFFFLPAQPCMICGKPTAFVEVNFEARLCPDYCADMMWLEYAEHLNKSGGFSPPTLQEVI